MLETVREYAWERLAAAGKLTAARRAHAHYFLALALRADPHLRGRDQWAWYLRLEREHDNLRAALRWLLDREEPTEREAALRLVGALGWFWLLHGYHTEGGRWVDEALARAPAAQKEVEGARVDLETAVERIRGLVVAGALLSLRGEIARARSVLEDALTLAERWQDLAGVAQIYTYLGLCSASAGDVAEATRLLHEAERRWEALGDSHGLGLTLVHLAYAADMAGDEVAAAERYAAALRRLDTAGDVHFAAYVHCYLGVAQWKRGGLPGAVEQVRAGVRTAVAFRDRWLLSFAAQATAALVGVQATTAARASLLGAVDMLAQVTGATFVWERLPGAREVAGLRERLAQGEGEHAAAYREGRALPFNEVAALALRLLEEAAQSPPSSERERQTAGHAEEPAAWHASQNPLTERELEVLRLVAQGHSSKVIGRQLFIATSTVNYHLTAIFNKLTVDTRAQAVAVAAQRGLL
jgi:ATP/maltotriose-dependent transcriptional regulator MalT